MEESNIYSNYFVYFCKITCQTKSIPGRFRNQKGKGTKNKLLHGVIMKYQLQHRTTCTVSKGKLKANRRQFKDTFYLHTQKFNHLYAQVK